MATSWAAKAPTAVRDYLWTPEPGTPLDSASAVVGTGTVTVVAEVNGDTVTLSVTGGADGVVQVLTATATAGDLTFIETFYLPIEASTNRLGYTARDVCLFALRKIAGNSEEPTAEELADALERLNDMLAVWRDTGADVGVKLPVLEADNLLVRDSFYSAMKLNLRNALHDYYGVPLTPGMVLEARSALSTVKNAQLVRSGPEYY